MNSNFQEFLNNERIKYNLAGLIVAISHEKNGDVITSGRSMTTVPVTKNMTYRIGGQGITILTTLFLILVDNGHFSIIDKIGTFLPKVPNGSLITLQMLCNMTSGLEDVINNAEVSNSMVENVFREWTTQDLLDIVYSSKPLYPPGDRFYFGHITNMLLLCAAIELKMNQPIEALLKKYIFLPLNLKNTKTDNTQVLEEPVFHAFVNVRVPTYEDSTYWNGSWGSYATKINSNAYDINIIANNLGSGSLLSDKSYHLMLGNSATNALIWYGMGVAVGGFGLDHLKSEKYPYTIIWTNENFNGYQGIWAYIPSEQIAINIQTNTYNNDGFEINDILENILKTFSLEDLKDHVYGIS
jgi:CubicO group peptidase (beta-lactamase class C family)